jgi:hypothetical protein
MIQPRPSVTRFVHAVVRAEIASGADADGSKACQRLLIKLSEELGTLIGQAGFDVLLVRSIGLAQRVHPALAGAIAGPGGSLAGLDNPSCERVDLDEGSLAVVTHFVELLALLIGEDLTMRLVGDVWPAAEESR